MLWVHRTGSQVSERLLAIKMPCISPVWQLAHHETLDVSKLRGRHVKIHIGRQHRVRQLRGTLSGRSGCFWQGTHGAGRGADVGGLYFLEAFPPESRTPAGERDCGHAPRGEKRPSSNMSCAMWQAWHEYEQTTTAAPGWDVEAGLGPRKPSKPAALASRTPTQDTKLMDAAEVNSFLAPCPPGPSSGAVGHSPPPREMESDSIVVAEPVLAKEVARASKASSCAQGPAGSMPSPCGSEAQAAVSVDIDSDHEHGTLPSTQGRAYDLNKVDEKLRKRLLKNRLSAERSRQRKQAHVEHLEFELSCCRSENEHLKKKVASLEAQVAALSLNTGCQPQGMAACYQQELTCAS